MRACALLFAVALTGCVDDNTTTEPPVDVVDDGVPDAAIDALIDAALRPDAAPDAASVADTCPDACARVVECALDGCDALSADDAPALSETCLTRCGELASIGPVVAGLSRCDEVNRFTEQAIPGVLDLCVTDPAFPPQIALCGTYGARLAECLVESCAPAEDHGAALAAGFAHECNIAVEMGADPSGIADIADAPCAAWAESVDDRTSGDLAAFCARGPLDDPADCVAACAVAAECLNPNAMMNQPFRNPDRCTMMCIASTDAPRGWQCLADAGTCDAIEGCFDQQPEPACRLEADRVVECVVGRCAPVEPLVGGLRQLLLDGCERALRTRARRVEEVQASAAAGTCDDPPLADRITTVVERPDDPANALGPTCDDGPRDPALCADACAMLTACLDPSNVLTDPDVCAFYCGTTATYDDAAFRCGADAASCEAMVACFTG